MNTRNIGLPVCKILKEKPLQSNSKNLDLISLAEAKAISGYNQDHLGLLCRTGKLQGQKIGRSWVVSREALLSFLEAKGITPRIPAAPLSVSESGFAVQDMATDAEPVQPAVIQQDAEVRVPREVPAHMPPVLPVSVPTEAVPHIARSQFSLPRVLSAVAAVVLFVLAASVAHLWQSEQGASRLLVDGAGWTRGVNDSRGSDKTGDVGQENDDDNNHDSDPAQRGDQQGIVLGDSTLVPLAGSGTGQATTASTYNSTTYNSTTAPLDFSRLGISEYQLNQLIAQQLTNLASIGLLGHSQGLSSSSPAPSYNSTTLQPTTPSVAPVITYIQPAPSQNFSGASLLSATDLSSTRFTTSTANVTDTATVKTLSVTGNAELAGDLTVAGNITGTMNGIFQPNFTQGSIAFQGANGLTQDSVGLYYDNTNNRLGLGTTTPVAVLDIRQQTNGQPIINAQRATNTAPTGNFITYKDATGNTLYSVDNSGNVTAAGIASSSALTVTATTTPQLRVQYNTNNEWTSSTNATGATTFAFNGSAPQGIFIPQADSATAFQFQKADASPVLSVDTVNGNVTIGAEGAASLLSAYANGSPYFVVDPVNTKTIALGDLDGNYEGTSIQLDMDNDWIDFGGFNSASKFGGYLNRAASTLQWGDGGSGNQTVFTINDAAQKFTFENGNVGIGTSAPQFALDIQGQTPQLVIQASSSTANIPAFTLKNDTGKYVQLWTAGSGAWHANRSLMYASALDFFADGNLGDGNINFYTNTPGAWVDVPKVTFAANGRVGIGTATPATSLEVAGTYVGGKGSLYVNPPTGHGYIQVNAAAASEAGFAVQSAGAVKWFLYRPASSNDLRLFDATADRVTFAQGGNVGIGTTNPVSRLVVQSGNGGNILTVSNTSAKNVVALHANSDGGGVMYAYDTNGNITGAWGEYGTLASGNLFGWTNSATNALGTLDTVLSRSAANTLRLSSDGSGGSAHLVVNGNVGIGTTAPTAKVHVLTGTPVADTYTIISQDSTYNRKIGFYWKNGGAEGGIKADSQIHLTPAGNLFLSPADGSGSGVIYSNGYLGAGDTGTLGAPASRISVNGGVSIGNGYYATVAPTNGLIVQGNVGIGTTGPTAQLHVIASSDKNTLYLDRNSIGQGSTVLVVRGGNGGGIAATSNAGHAISGIVTGGGSYAGVYGEQSGGYGVQGSATNGGRGVYGMAHNGIGVYGYDDNVGTAGYFDSVAGYGLLVARGNVGIGTATPQAKLDVRDGAIVNSGTNVNYYRNVANYAPGTSPTGTLKITLPKANNSQTYLNITIRGFNYIANANYGEWEVKVAGYDYGTEWHAYGAEISGNAPFSSVRLANDGTSKVILLGTTSTTWVSPAVVITDVMTSGSNNSGWASGWGITIVSNETGIAGVYTVTPQRNGQLVFANVPSSVPIATDTSYTSLMQISGSQYVRLGVVDGGGGIPTRASYVQGGYTGSALYYQLSLNPNGGNVGIGTTSTSSLLTIGSGTPTTAVNGLNFGTDTSANLYRSSNGVIKTDGYFVSAQSIQAAGTIGNGGNVSSGAGFYGTYAGGAANISQFQDLATIASATTGTYSGLDVRPSTTAASFTLGTLNGVYVSEGSKGAGSTVTIQHGVNVGPLTFGSTIYGIRSQVTSGSNKYNLYLDGTAQNYIAGNVGIGTTSPNTKVDIFSSAGGEVLRIGNASNIYTSFQTGTNGTFTLSNTYGSSYTALTIDSVGSVNMPHDVSIGLNNGTSSGSLIIRNTGSATLKTGINLFNQQTTAGSDIDIGFGAYNEARYASIRGVYSGTTQVGSLAFNTANGGSVAEAMRITNAGNVGIGTTTPGSQLELNQNISYTGPTSSQLRISGTGTKWLNLGYDSTSNYGFIQTVESGVSYRNLILNGLGGNVGIGTTAPGGLLDVYKSTSSGSWGGYPNITVNNPNTTGTSYATFTVMNGGASGLGVTGLTGQLQGLTTNGASPSLQLMSGDAAYPLYLTSGATLTNGITVKGANVGIGTTSPGAPLDVKAATSNTNTIQVRNTAGVVTFGTGPTSDGYGFIALNDSSGTEKIHISARTTPTDNTFFNAGNIGMGTTSPDAVLELAGNRSQSAWGLNGIALQGTAATYTDSSTAVSATATNAVFNSFGQPTLAASNTGVTTTNAATVYIADAPAAGTNQTITNPYSLWVDNGTARFDGNVAIGTTSPVSPLDIYGGSGDGTTNEAFGLRIRGTNVAGNSATLNLGANGTTYAYIQSAYWGSGYVAPLYLNPKGSQVYINATTAGSAASSSVSLVSARDILIKHASATNAELGRIGFSVDGAYGTNGTFPAYIGGYADNGIWSSGIGLVFSTLASADVSGSNGTERMRITSSGNVGIGTTNPTSLLRVDKNQNSETALTVANLNTGAAAYSVVRVNNSVGTSGLALTSTGYTPSGVLRADGAYLYASGAGGMTINTEVAQPVYFGINNAEKMRLDTNGNLGIGSTSPTQKLDVAGYVRAYSSSANVGLSVSYTGVSGREYQLLSCAGCNSGGAGTLEVFDATAGAARAYIASGVNGWQTPSDRRLKTNIETLTVLDKLSALRGTSYTLIESGKQQIGVIAQELQQAFPFAVTGSETNNTYLGVSYDAVATIALQGVKELNDKLASLQGTGMNFAGSTPLVLKSQLYLSADSVGQAKILAGSTSVRVAFTKPYEQQPIVTATANGRVGSEYWVAEKDATGFTLYIEVPATVDITFDWHAFASPEAKLTVSDGTTQQLVLVLPPQPAPEDGSLEEGRPLSGEVAGESTGTDSDSNSDNGQTQSQNNKNDNDPVPLEDSGTGQATAPPTPSPTPTPDS